MSTMIPDLVVGEVGFGPNLGLADDEAKPLIALGMSEAKVRELIRSNNRLIRVLKRCVKPSNEIACEAHDAIEEAMANR